MSFFPSQLIANRLLIFACAFAAVYQAGFSVASINVLRNGTTEARSPMQFGFRLEAISDAMPEAELAGVHWGDKLLEVDGRPFTGELVLAQAVGNRRAGELLPVVVARPNGTRHSASIRLAPIRSEKPSLSSWLISLAIQIVLPTFCLVLGFWVALARPEDRLAWLLLALMIGFSQIVEGFSWSWPLMPLAVTWNAALGHPFGVWLVWLVLFGIYFPKRASFDQKRPWIKWLLLTPLALQALFFFVLTIGSDYKLSALHPLKPLLGLFLKVPVQTYLSFTALIAFSSVIWMQSITAESSDSRRRIRILYFGTVTSLAPLFIVAIISVVRGEDIFRGVPQWAVITTLLTLLLFPITMAYVIVVQRAMEVSVVIRQGVKYALARSGFRVVRGLLLGLAIVLVSNAFADSQPGILFRVFSTCFLVLVAVSRRKFSDRFSLWIDKRFFRESYSAELVMSELAQEARQFTEIQPLLATVANRVSETLHVARMAVFLRDGNRFHVAETIGLQAALVPSLTPQSQTAHLLSEATKPEMVYFDDPRSWVHAASEAEQNDLRSLQTEVLLALPGRKQLLGLIALGPKLSEEPYSPSDLRLLQSVAVQTGFALENTQLLAEVAHEAGQRERLNREIEIAREVQQRLFPQSCPSVPGIEYFGMCRPALAVGGDYFDYILRPDGRLGIALGDVSGKGISAALMMASLQSLLRGQIEAGLQDLAVLLTNTNRLIYDVSTSNRYVTFFYGEYDPANRGMTYVNAGHNPPMVLRGSEVIRLEACGPVVGLLRSVSYQSAFFKFQSGDVFITYTDGISEAMTIDDEEWGEDRMIESLRQSSSGNASEIAIGLMKAADAFTAGAEQHDDMTLITMKVL